jgi:phosphohistidine phosphatase SixA
VKRWLLALALLLLLPSAAPAGTFFLLRHADDLDEGRDPVLTDVGESRARELADMLEPAGIDYILSSDYHRTRDTVAPLAALLDLPVELYDPRDLPALVAILRERGEVGLVVGHSNTTPDLVELLGGDPGTPIAETEFDRLYVVVTDFSTPATTIRLRYGPAFTSP